MKRVYKINIRVLLLSLMIFFVLCSKKEYQFKKEKIDLGIDNNFRGLSLSDDNIIWVGGSRGCFISSADLGKTWKVDSIERYKKLDFRSSLAKNKNSAILLSAGSPAIMIQTNDGGNSWENVFTDSSKTVFFNSIKHNIAIGDPQGMTIDIIKKTINKWERLKSKTLPKIIGNEAGFAASNTCIDYDSPSKTYWIGLGGEEKVRVYISQDDANSFKAVETPMLAGKARGIYSIDFKNSKIGVAVGGSYLKPNDTTNIAIYSNDGGKTWKLSNKQPSGYRSCVTHFKDDIFVAVGTNGLDISYNNGKTWHRIDDINLNAIKFFKNTNIAIAVGQNAAVYKYTFFK